MTPLTKKNEPPHTNHLTNENPPSQKILPNIPSQNPYLRNSFMNFISNTKVSDLQLRNNTETICFSKACRPMRDFRSGETEKSRQMGHYTQTPSTPNQGWTDMSSTNEWLESCLFFATRKHLLQATLIGGGGFTLLDAQLFPVSRHVYFFANTGFRLHTCLIVPVTCTKGGTKHRKESDDSLDMSGYVVVLSGREKTEPEGCINSSLREKKRKKRSVQPCTERNCTAAKGASIGILWKMDSIQPCAARHQNVNVQ